MPQTTLGQLAFARSGDKGAHANIGIIAYTAAGYAFLQHHLTAAVVAGFLHSLAPKRVVRYELPKLRAFNFVLYNVLEGGGSRSLRIDAQGKVLGQALLYLPLDVPTEVLDG